MVDIAFFTHTLFITPAYTHAHARAQTHTQPNHGLFDNIDTTP